MNDFNYYDLSTFHERAAKGAPQSGEGDNRQNAGWKKPGINFFIFLPKFIFSTRGERSIMTVP